MKVLYDVYICCSNIYGNRLSDVYLYGSYALGDYDNESDVDILVTANIDTPEHGDYFNKISILSSRLSLKYDLTVSVSVKPQKQFLRYAATLPFYINVLKEGIKCAA